MGKLVIPEDHALGTLTVRVQAGREQTSAASLRLDMIYLGPAFEHAAIIASPSQLASGEFLASDAATTGVFHLDTSAQLSEVGTAEGPTPLELVPGYQVLVGFPLLEPLAGYVDPATEVASSPTVRVTHAPRYRT